MTNLKETAWSVAKEYARQVAELLDLNPQDCYWVGSDNDERKTIDICDMGTGTLFLTLDEIQTIIDRLPEWIARYGSREAVADEINDWNEWWLQDATDITEAARQRIIHTLRPRLCLRDWLSGTRETDIADTNSVQTDYIRLTNDTETLDRLIREYGENRSIGNVRQQLTARLKIATERKQADDRQILDRIMRSETGEQFQKAIEETKGGKV